MPGPCFPMPFGEIGVCGGELVAEWTSAISLSLSLTAISRMARGGSEELVHGGAWWHVQRLMTGDACAQHHQQLLVHQYFAQVALSSEQDRGFSALKELAKSWILHPAS